MVPGLSRPGSLGGLGTWSGLGQFLDSFPLFVATSGHIQTREEWAQVSKELDSKELETKKSKKLTKKWSKIDEN